jgi:hypothetical protein
VSGERSAESKRRMAVRDPREAAGKERAKVKKRRAVMGDTNAEQITPDVSSEVVREALRIRAAPGAGDASSARSEGDAGCAVAGTERTVAEAQRHALDAADPPQDAVLSAIMAMADTGQDPETIVGSAELSVQSALAASVRTETDMGEPPGARAQ